MLCYTDDLFFSPGATGMFIIAKSKKAKKLQLPRMELSLSTTRK
jgi:hypothetical protein